MARIYLQLFANSKTNSESTSVSTSHTAEEGGSSYSKEGGSHSETNTKGQSVTNAESHTTSNTQGNSSSLSVGKTWASGKVDENTQANFNKYNQEYVQSDKVTAAYDALQQTLSQKPTFESQYADKLSGLYDQIMNRDAFSYNFNEDQMYQMYRDKYAQEGKTAMEDTLGKAQSMNGGYGSSYSQSAAQQTYQNYLKEATDIIPTLRNQAYTEYQQEGQDLLNKYNITNQAYNNEYGQYRDSVSDWQADRSYNYGMYSDERNFDYSKYQDNRNYWQQEYWNEKNAEQSNYQASNTWYEENSKSDTNSRSQTDYWENSVTDTSYWENGSTNTWGNSTTNAGSYSQSLSNTSTKGSGSGTTGSSLLGSDIDWTGYATTTKKANSYINDMLDAYGNTANQNEEISARSGQNAITNSLKSAGVNSNSSLYNNGMVLNMDEKMASATTDDIKTAILDMIEHPEGYGLVGSKQEMEFIAERYLQKTLEKALGENVYRKYYG